MCITYGYLSGRIQIRIRSQSTFGVSKRSLVVDEEMKICISSTTKDLLETPNMYFLKMCRGVTLVFYPLGYLSELCISRKKDRNIIKQLTRGRGFLDQSI
jgi:hypothetical protein